ncbi:unnamed protein product [Soboliphyme baturini]|uniref:PHB domain-containing protein n=1 Tax=Soboliphyme baturini TaxID=241478 RepID=A0A183IZ36_9BILA|nr:unnamed protein product [Soboliphyme baturini]
MLITLSWLLFALTFPVSIFFCVKIIQEYERIFFILPCIESYTKVDLRTVSFDVPTQEILTKDSVTISVDAVVYYRINNATISVANIENVHYSTRLLAQTTLRNILGTKNLSEILSDREAIAACMQTMLDETTDRWGIKVERVEMYVHNTDLKKTFAFQSNCSEQWQLKQKLPARLERG